jgi:hypothetical protein
MLMTKHLQSVIDSVQNSCLENGMILNVGKTNIVFFNALNC